MFRAFQVCINKKRESQFQATSGQIGDYPKSQHKYRGITSHSLKSGFFLLFVPFFSELGGNKLAATSLLALSSYTHHLFSKLCGIFLFTIATEVSLKSENQLTTWERLGVIGRCTPPYVKLNCCSAVPVFEAQTAGARAGDTWKANNSTTVFYVAVLLLLHALDVRVLQSLSSEVLFGT